MTHEIAYAQLTRIFSNVCHLIMGQPAVSALRRARAEYAAIGRLERSRRTPTNQFEEPSMVGTVPILPDILQDNVEPGKNPYKITPGHTSLRNDF